MRCHREYNQQLLRNRVCAVGGCVSYGCVLVGVPVMGLNGEWRLAQSHMLGHAAWHLCAHDASACGGQVHWWDQTAGLTRPSLAVCACLHGCASGDAQGVQGGGVFVNWVPYLASYRLAAVSQVVPRSMPRKVCLLKKVCRASWAPHDGLCADPSSSVKAVACRVA